MGIQGLLPFLKDATHRVNVSKYSGCTVAVDTYCWIHRGAFGCAMQLAKGEQTDMYVRYCLKFINMLRAMDIKPVLVFDGSHLPAKKAVEKSRRERRELYSKKGKQFLRDGKVSEARDCFTKCINVTPQMALEVIKAARSLDVDCIVAPYEADAQLAYLATCGIAQAVITEDSDLMAFGCPRVIYKLDLSGNGMEIEASRLNQAMKMGQRFSADKFRYMCITSGCDYLASLPGIGLGKARKLFQTASNPDLTHVLKRMPIHLKMKLTVPPEYITGFHQANNTFLYQLAFDPIKRRLVPLHPYSDDVDRQTLSYAGSYYKSDLALQHALGNVDPNTKKQICDFKPQRTKPYDKSVPRHMLSIWHKDYRPGPDYIEEDKLAALQGHTTKGKEVVLMVNALKVEGHRRKRYRPDEDDEDTASNDDLTSIYCSPHAKRHSAGHNLSVPETPESRDKEAVRASSQPRNPFSKEGTCSQSPKCGFGAEERVVKTLSKRNIFAKGWSSSSSRLDILKGSTVITSRFFPTRPDQKPQEISKDVGNGMEDNSLPQNQSVWDDEMCSSVHETNEQGMTKDTDIAYEKTNMEQHQGPTSILNRLQCFQRKTSASAMPLTCSKSPKESALCSVGVSEVKAEAEINSESEHVSSQKRFHSSVMSAARESTQTRHGAFNWSRRSTRDESARNFRRLSDFKKNTVKARLLKRDDYHSERQLDDVESSQGGVSGGSMASSQQSHLCSIDIDSLSSSQFSGQSFTEDNSQGSESGSLCLDMENSSKIQSQQEGLSNSSSNSASPTNVHEQNQGVDANGPDSRNKHSIQTLTVQPRAVCESEESLPPDRVASNQDDVQWRRSDMASTLQIEGEDFVDLKTLNDENSSPTDNKTQTGLMTKMMHGRDLDTTPALPSIPKLKQGSSSSKLIQCKASGLSRRQKNKQTSKVDENRVTGARQQTLFAFMKKNHERKDAIMPLSPSKQNIITSDITSASANSLCNKGIVRVQRNMFKST